MKLIPQYLLFVVLCFTLVSYSQEVKKDTIVYKDVYGFRVGIDLYNPIRTAFDR